jgi:hypothetical protein
MNPFEFVITILILTFLFKLLNSWIGAKSARRSSEESGAEAAELQRRLNEVEERVRVLERIVTDERYDLKQQFRDLAS